MALAAYYRDFYLKDKLFLTENSWDGWAEVADLRRADRAKQGLGKIDYDHQVSLLPVGQGWAKSDSGIGFGIIVSCSSDNPGLSLHECAVFVVRILAFSFTLFDSRTKWRLVSLVCCRNRLLVFWLCDRTLTDGAPHFYTDSYIMWLLALVEDIIAYSLLSSILAVIVSGLLWNVWADISSVATFGNGELWF